MKCLFFIVTMAFAVVFGETLYADENLPKSSGINCLTSKCHSGLVESKFTHSPLKAKGCIACHEVVTGIKKNERLPKDHLNVAIDMGQNQVAICQKCHVEWSRNLKTKQYLHGAILQEGCTSCHNPHGGANSKFLRLKEFNQELCISCHKKGNNWEKGDKDIVHQALNEKNKCLNCHEIHAGHVPKLLKQEYSKLCLSCHEKVAAVKLGGSLHTPVKEGGCFKCHSPHYANKKKLLSKNYESLSYVNSTETSFQLCLSCHTQLRTTQFRNGDKNLHELHISMSSKNKNTERGCSVCHDVHGSTQAMQIRTSFSYKQYSLPLMFLKTEQGGSCTTACHGKKDYDRLNPVINKEGR